MSCFVKVPFGTRLDFPNRCPFSGAVNPKGRVLLIKSRFQWLLPIPFFGWVSGHRLSQMVLPATKCQDFADFWLRLLKEVLPIGGLFGALASLRFTDSEFFGGPVGYTIFVGCVLAAWTAMLTRTLILRRVRIVAFGQGSCELRFVDEDYGRKFAELNDLPLGRERRH